MGEFGVSAMVMDPIATYRAVLVVFSVGILITTLEYFTIIREFQSGGIYSWEVVRGMVSRARAGKSWRKIVDLLYEKKGVSALLLLRLASAILLIGASPERWEFTALAATLAVSHLAFSLRQVFGEDGADQMNSIIVVTIALCVGPHSSPWLLEMGLWFLALQACLSYFSAGVAKLVSPVWRSGAAVLLVFNTGSYGEESAGAFLTRYPALARAMTWGTIVFEVAFPACLLLPPSLFWLTLCCGVGFHLTIALVMGLNNFVWSFLAVYPAIAYVAARTSRILW
jgi:hypothetical protein